jgi:hypothetical protein
MRKIFTLSFVALFTLSCCFGQNVAVNADASLPNASAMLDVKSSIKGMLIPRVALTGTGDVTTIANPATSLMIYNTASAGSGTSTVVPGYYYWEGSWTRMLSQKSGAAVNFADFYALMPGDNISSVPIGGAIAFPRTDIPNSIIIAGINQFILPDAATYEISFQVSVSEPTQLGISLNGFLVPASVVGRATGTTQLTGLSLITTTLPYTSLNIVNTGYAAITLPPMAGGINPVSAHLIIKKLN